MTTTARTRGRGATRLAAVLTATVGFGLVLGPRTSTPVVGAGELAAIVQPSDGPAFKAKKPAIERDLDGTAQPAANVEAHASDSESPPPPPPPSPDHQPLRPVVLATDFPDPSVIHVGGTFVAFATNAGGRNVQVATSTDLTNWSLPSDAMPLVPAWAHAGLSWAPSVAFIGGQYVLYVSLPENFTGRQCVDRLVSPSPTGPFGPVPPPPGPPPDPNLPPPDPAAPPVPPPPVPPLLCNVVGGSGVIDPSPLVTADGRVFLYWKSAGSKARQLFVNELTPDGLNVAGPPVSLLTATASWEGGGIENPDMVRAGGQWWLFYSANWWIDERYTMGYAVCDSPVGPCRKPTGGPWLSSRDGVAGPGGGSVFSDPAGGIWLTYVSWNRGIGYSRGGERQMHVEPMEFVSGVPRLADRMPAGSLDALLRVPGGVQAAGWAADPDSGRPIAVRLSAGSYDLGTVVGADPRSDLAAIIPQSGGAHGFAATLPLAPGVHQVCAYAVDDVGLGGTMLGCAPVEVSAAPIGGVNAVTPVAGGLSVAGWAIDPDIADAVAVDVYVDGVASASIAAAGSRPDVGALFPAYGAGHGFAVTVPAPAGEHQVCVYAVDDTDLPSARLGCTTVAPGITGPSG